MTSSFLPDINVWIALQYEAHRHHAKAVAWFRSLDDSASLVFCRHTQIGMFRLLTTDAVMQGAPLTQKQCWGIYARWIDGGTSLSARRAYRTGSAFQRLTLGGCAVPQDLGRRLSRRICRDGRTDASHLRPRTGREGEGGGAARLARLHATNAFPNMISPLFCTILPILTLRQERR